MNRSERKYKRVHVPMPLIVAVLNEDSSVQSEEEGTLYDLSAGGCAFYLNREIPIGQRVQVRITLAQLLARRFMKPELTARGAICRIERHENRYLLGCRFFK